MARAAMPVVAESRPGGGPPWRICGSAAGWRDRARRSSAGASSRPGRRRSASCNASTRSRARESLHSWPGRWSVTGRSARRRSTSARSSFRKAACRLAGSSPRPWPASPPIARPGCWPSRVPCRAPSPEPCDRRRTAALGDTSGPSEHPGAKRSDRRSGAATAPRTPASSRLLHACPCAAGRCCRAAAVRRPSRPRCRHIVGRHRRSGFPRSARSGGRRRAGRGAECPRDVAAASGPRSRRRAGSFRTDSQYSAGKGASGAAADGAGLRAASAASFSICFGVGMRQLAGRSVICELEHNKNKCRVRLNPDAENKSSRQGDRDVGTKPCRSS